MKGGIDTTDSITCGHCGTAFTGTKLTYVFRDKAWFYGNCSHCHAVILIKEATDAEYNQLLQAYYDGELAAELTDLTNTISDRSASKAQRMQAVDRLKERLQDCLADRRFDKLTATYTKAPDPTSLIGYDSTAVSIFMNQFRGYYHRDPHLKVDQAVMCDTWLYQLGSRAAVPGEFIDQILTDPSKLFASLSPEPDDHRSVSRKETAMSASQPNQKITTVDIMATAARMFKNYTNRGEQLINFFRVTQAVLPDDPTPDERAAFDFFDNRAQAELVLPMVPDSHLFREDSKRLQMLLASDTDAEIRVVTNSKLAYQLFLSQVALDIQNNGLPTLDQISLLSKPATAHYQLDPALRYITQTPLPAKDPEAKPATTTYRALTLQDAGDGYQDGTLHGTVYFTLTPLTVTDTTTILQAFAPHYEKVHNVTFEAEALVALATGSRTILQDVADPEKALLLLDQIAAEHTQGPDQTPVLLDKHAVQETLAAHYHSFPSAVLDKTTVRGLEAQLNQQVIAQPDATKAVAKAMTRASLGLNNPHRPIATFLFAGPTGVGKTELAKQLAKDLYGSEKEYVRLDMSEFSSHEEGLSKLIGSAPSYKNSEQGGKLTTALKDHPNAIILFDEFEKASADVHNLMLQVLDDARLTSGLGKTYSLTANILIFTSNAGMEAHQHNVGFGQTSPHYVFSKEKFGETFPKELLNRFSKIVVFQPLDKASLAPILELKLKRYYEQFTQMGITLTIDQAAKNRLIDLGYDPEMGARPLERAIDDALVTPIADYLLQTNDVQSLTVTVDADNEITVSGQQAPIASAPDTAMLYVDGAFNPQTSTYGYGGLLIANGQTTELNDAGDDSDFARLRDYGGEMNGVVAGLRQAQAAGITEITVVYDYQGIEGWATGRWRANQPETVAYHDAIAELEPSMQLYFQLEKGLQSDEKKRANQLAKAAVGLY